MGLERCIELLRAGVERFGAGLELADERLPAFGQRPLDTAEASFELGAQRACSAAEQRNHAAGAIVKKVGQRAGEAIGGVGQLGDARVEQAGEGLTGGRQAVGDRIEPGFDRIEDRHRTFIDAIDQGVARIVDRHRQFGRGVEDRVADDVAGGADLLAQRFVRTVDRRAHALCIPTSRTTRARSTSFAPAVS